MMKAHDRALKQQDTEPSAPSESLEVGIEDGKDLPIPAQRDPQRRAGALALYSKLILQHLKNKAWDLARKENIRIEQEWRQNGKIGPKPKGKLRAEVWSEVESALLNDGGDADN